MKTTSASRISADIDATAADWVIRRDAGLTRLEALEYERWLGADPQRAAAVVKFEKTWSRLENARSGGRARELMRALSTRATRRRRRIAAGAGLLTVLVGVLVISASWWPTKGPDSAAPAISGLVREPRVQRLSDGSVVELKNGAEITVDFSAQFRRITLRNGEAMFQVAANANRPFIVTASGIDIRAVGTAFVVGLERNTVDVIVTEGRVAVGNKSLDNQSQVRAPISTASLQGFSTTVDAGKRLTVALAAGSAVATPVVISQEEVATRLGWRETRIEFSRTPLADAVEQMNRRSKIQMVIDDPELARLPVTGLFRADNTETLVRLLEANFGIKADRNGEVVTLRKDNLGNP